MNERYGRGRPPHRPGRRPPRDFRPPARTPRLPGPPNKRRDVTGASVARHMRNRRRSMNYSVSIVSIMFFSFIVVYLTWSVVQFFRPGINTEIIRMDVFEVQRFTQAVLVRDEILYRAEIGGTVVSAVRDFTRVSRGDIVASIQDVEAVDAIQAAIQEIEDQAFAIHERRFHTPTDIEIERINTSIRSLMDSGVTDFSQLSLSDIHLLNDRLAQQAEIRNQTIINSIRPIMQDIDRELTHAEQVQDLHMHNIHATRGGIVSPFLDGFEEHLTPFTVRYLARADTLIDPDYSTLEPARLVEENDPVFKIVGNEWFVAGFFPIAEVEGFVPGVTRTIFLESAETGRFEPIQKQVDFVTPYENEAFVVFRSTRNVERFINQRSVNIRTFDNVQSGLRIPTSAIVSRNFLRIPLTHLHGFDDNHFLMRHVAEGMAAERVDVFLDRIEGAEAYVTNEGLAIGIGDFLIPIHLDDVLYQVWDTNLVIVRGVFRANLGVAEFRIIHLDDENFDPAAGHVILNPARNRSLMQFDVVVTDGASVRPGDIVNR